MSSGANIGRSFGARPTGRVTFLCSINGIWPLGTSERQVERGEEGTLARRELLVKVRAGTGCVGPRPWLGPLNGEGVCKGVRLGKWMGSAKFMAFDGYRRVGNSISVKDPLGSGSFATSTVS